METMARMSAGLFLFLLTGFLLCVVILATSALALFLIALVRVLCGGG